MVTVKWLIEDRKVFIYIPSSRTNRYFWFSRRGNKKFRLQQILNRRTIHSAFSDSLIPFITSPEGWKDEIVREEELLRKFKIVLVG